MSENKEKAEIKLTELQCACEEKLLREKIQNYFVSDVNRTTKEDANLARSYAHQIEESLESLINPLEHVETIACDRS